jgi:hypothetical protein
VKPRYYVDDYGHGHDYYSLTTRGYGRWDGARWEHLTDTTSIDYVSRGLETGALVPLELTDLRLAGLREDIAQEG